MSRLWSFVLGLRPWLIGIAVWLVAATLVHMRDGSPRTSAVLGLLLTFLLGAAGLVRVLWPMRTYGNPPAMVAAAKRYDLHTYTGRVGSASKTSSTTFLAASSVTQNPMTGDVSHQLSTSQRTTIQDDVTLHGADGTQHNVQVSDVNLAVGPGQLVSAKWAIRPGSRSGPYVMFRNHTTGVDAFPRGRLWWLATGRVALGYLVCMWLGGILLLAGGYGGMGVVWFLVPFAYIGLGYYRAARFRRTSRALAGFLDGVAATFRPSDATPQQAFSTSGPAYQDGQSASPQVRQVPPPRVAPPAWLADPTGRHDHRFWDGTLWTDHVADAGVAATDPVQPGTA